MKKTLISTIFLLAAIVLPASAQAQSIFNLKSPTKIPVAAPVTPAPTAVTAETVVDDEITVTDLQNQPLPVRRRIVADQLADIHLRLSMLSDKTKTAAQRLATNDIDTSIALTELSKSTLALADAKLSIDALVAAAYDPKNETATTLSVNGTTFKESVISVEGVLRSARQSVITALGALKAAVTASVSVQ